MKNSRRGSRKGPCPSGMGPARCTCGCNVVRSLICLVLTLGFCRPKRSTTAKTPTTRLSIRSPWRLNSNRDETLTMLTTTMMTTPTYDLMKSTGETFTSSSKIMATNSGRDFDQDGFQAGGVRRQNRYSLRIPKHYWFVVVFLWLDVN